MTLLLRPQQKDGLLLGAGLVYLSPPLLLPVAQVCGPLIHFLGSDWST